MGQYREPVAARAEVERVDVTSGEGLARLEVVRRGILRQFQDQK